jgi:diguanylate cyclase (GGDEF)-like protein
MKTNKPISVLLVEDNPGDARLVKEFLAETSNAQFNLTHVDRFEEAFRRLSETSFDVVLLDLSLPDAQGLGTVRRIHMEFPAVPIVVLSGMSDEALAVQAVQGGAQDYLVKGEGGGSLLMRSMRYAIERKQSEERLAYLAQYDHLTGLANRALFRDRLNQALARAERNNQSMALMFLDLDHFKSINDTLGHDAGDQLLEEVAKRLKSCVRKTDTVARIGGDEFTVILEGIASNQDPIIVAQKMIDKLSTPFIVAGQEVFSGISVGITVYPDDGETARELLKYADRAMYRAKDLGCNNYQFYAADLNLRATERLTFRNSLYHALDRDQFMLYYQPQVEVNTGKIVGVEALLRWHLPQFGVLRPDRFIGIAEETELIAPIGEWVLRTACAKCREWLDKGVPPLNMSVNISARQFRRPDLASMIEEILHDTGLNPRRLELELTEGTLMENTDVSITTLTHLKEMGVRVSVDDFGTGYCSLSYLRRFALDSLKIAQPFIDDITLSSDDAAISLAVIALAHSLRLSVIAEGVETQAQLDILKKQGCDIAQGFLFSHPLPDHIIEQVLVTGSMTPTMKLASS